jgi:EPS-associated MarR family transcriptional regulator
MIEQTPTIRTFPVTEHSELGVLRLLETEPSRSQREVAAELGMSLGKANYLFKALLDKGFLKIQNFRNSSNKRAYAYLLTPEGVAAKADLTRKFLARKIVEYDALKLEIERLRQETEERDR